MIRKIWMGFAAACGVGVAVAALGAAPAPQELPEGVTAAMVEEGQQVFSAAGICFTCHGPDGGGTPLAPDLTDDEWLHSDGDYESIVNTIMEGVSTPKQFAIPMMPKGGTQITADQVRAVAAYVWTLSQG